MFEVSCLSLQPYHKEGEGIKYGSKPMFLFQGSAWQQDPTYEQFMNLLLDFFGGNIGNSTVLSNPLQYNPDETDFIGASKVCLSGFDHVISVTVDADGIVYFRIYNVHLKKSDVLDIPRVELTSVGPNFNWKLGRTSLPSDGQWKESNKRPKTLEGHLKKKKNIERDDMGDTYGTVHIPKQSLGSLQLRKVRALK